MNNLDRIRWSRPEHLHNEALAACAFSAMFFFWTFLNLMSVNDTQLLHILIGVDVVVTSTVAMAAYACFRNHTFLADVPKGNWLFRGGLFAVLLVSPINWAILTVSLVRMSKTRKLWVLQQQDQLVREQSEAEFNVQREQAGSIDEVREKAIIQTSISSLPEYPSSPNAGEAAYVQVIESHDIGSVREKRDMLEDKLEETRELIGKLQKTLNETRASIVEYDGILDKYKEQNADRQIELQFRKLIELPGVLAVQVKNNKLQLFVRCQATVDGKRYFLGDWRISVKPGSSKLKTKLVHDGRRPDADGYSDPPHINADDDSFCFGGNEEELEDLLKRGQVFAALICAMTYMCQTLPGNEHQIPEVFKELKG